MTTMAKRTKLGKDSQLDEVALRLEAVKDGSVPGKVAFFGFEYSELVILLGGMIEFEPTIPELERQKILRKAIFEAGVKGKITSNFLLKSCHKQENEYLRRPVATYRLLTGVSLASVHTLPSIRIGSSTITFNPKAEVAKKHRARLYNDVKFSLGFDLPTQYMDVSVTVKARSPFEGAQCALDAIDVARATWNLCLNKGIRFHHYSGRARPVNDIVLCPFHTMHNVDGSLATESYWYDPGYSRPMKQFSDTAEIDRLFTFSKKLRRRLSQSTYSHELTDSLVRYVRALDAADLNDAFLRLWSILEFLTDDDSTGRKSEATIRRAAFMVGGKDNSVQVLNHLLSHRNRFVHAGTDTNEINSLVYLLKRYVDELLMFHIRNPFKFETLASAALFMDQPQKKPQIDEDIRRLRDAQKSLRNAQKFLAAL